MKKILITTGGGDCPGLNAVIRGIVKRAATTDYEIWGSIEAFQGILKDPVEIIHLTPDVVAGIHVKGGTILKTTNKFRLLSIITVLAFFLSAVLDNLTTTIVLISLIASFLPTVAVRVSR